MSRIYKYFAVWLAVIILAVTCRYTIMRGTESDERFALTAATMVATLLFLGAAGIYERRRIALISGLRGSGLFGYLRGWIKSGSVELATDGIDVPMEAEKEFAMFERLSAYAFGSMALVIPILMF